MKGTGHAADFSGRRPRLRSIILVGSALGGVSAGAIPAWAQVPCTSPQVTTSCTNSVSLTETLTIPSAASIGALNNIGTIRLSQMPGPQNGDGIFNDGGDVGILNNSGTILLSGLHNGYGILNNGGTIVTLANSGFIGATAKYGAAIFNKSGTISTLNNTGTLSGGTISTYAWEGYGVMNGGFIATLNNNGLIESNGAAHELNIGVYEYGYTPPETPPPSPQYGIGTLNNNGIIEVSGDNSLGIMELHSTISSLNNNRTIEVSGHDSTGIMELYGTISSLNNAGLINAAGRCSSIGIANEAGTTTILNNSGVIDATAVKESFGIANFGMTSTLNNSGTINTSSEVGAGIANLGGAQYANSYGTITNLNNSGLIAATGKAVSGIDNYLGTITTLDNTGSIKTTSLIGAGILNVGSNNHGTITNVNNTGLIAATGTDVGGIVNYQGAITTLTNAGTINAKGSALGIGIGNYQGTITTLDNTGLVEAKDSAVNFAISNNGTIGTLNNSGTIVGATDAILLAGGRLGSLNNSGVIAGTIENDSGQALNIAGGSGTVYGVLTGYGVTPGATGSLNSKGANVNFTSGNLLLNDNINVGTATVTNSGATLLVNGTVSVTSSRPFMLSGGMLKVGDINNPNASLTSTRGLNISGTGILRGHGTVNGNVINSGMVYPGGSLGILNIDGNYTQTSAGTLQVDLTPGRTSQLAVTGTADLSGSIDVNMIPGSYEPGKPYTILTAKSVTNKITQVTSSGPFAPLFEHYLTPTFDHSITGTTALIFQPTVLANGSMPAFTSGRFYVGSAYADTNEAQTVLTTPFGTDDNANNESRGYWLHGIGDFGSANGYNFNSKGFVIGKGFDVSKHLTIGGGLSNVYTTSKAQGSSVNGKSFGVLAYGIYQEGPMTLATSAGIGFLHNKTTRYLPYLDWTANATNNGINEGVVAKLQYRLLSASSRYFLTPYAQTSYIHNSLSGMQEGNAGGLDLYYRGFKTNVSQLGAGAMGGYSLPVKFGRLTAWGSLGGVGTIGNPHASVTEHLGPYTDRQSALAAPIGAFTPALGLALQGNRIWHISAGWNGQFGSAISANNLTLQLGAIW